MTVDRKTDHADGKFPAGMRVLAVDDNPACLKLLEALLRKCKYHVTTASQAMSALKILRENKDKFDLVISDVHMPDMDGFKLLELVGLEMDLPVIMLSAYGDTEYVMKGITHGACDYLLKPVRLEELKNIWQHVIRRKKLDPKDQKNSDRPHCEIGEVGDGFIGARDLDHDTKQTKKRKDQNDNEADEHDEDGDNNEDPSTQKKPRIVWSGELHRKFVTAVHQLGLERAAPKRILEKMNVEKLTRVNVASHLQKYRKYLKRIEFEASQQADMVAALGRADSSYDKVADLDSANSACSLMGTINRVDNHPASSGNSLLGRLNSPAGLGMLGLSSVGMVRHGHGQNLNNTVNGMANFCPLLEPEKQNGSIFEGVPLSEEHNQMHHNQNFTKIKEISANTNESMGYPISNVFSGGRINVGSSSSPPFGIQNNFVTTEEHFQCIQVGDASRNHSSFTAKPLTSEPPYQLLDFERCNESWPSAVQSSQIQSNSYTLSECFNQTTPSDMRELSNMAMHIGINLHAQIPDRRTDLIGSNAPNILNSSVNSSIAPHFVADPQSQRIYPESMIPCVKNDFSFTGQPNFVDPLALQHNEFEQLQLTQTYPWTPQCSYAHNSSSSLENLVALMMEEEQDKLLSNEAGSEFDTSSHPTATLPVNERSICS